MNDIRRIVLSINHSNYYDNIVKAVTNNVERSNEKQIGGFLMYKLLHRTSYDTGTKTRGEMKGKNVEKTTI